jgi:uncharacterized protein
MDISMLDGFLTALVIGPNTLMPSQWLPSVWGEGQGQEMVWDSAEQAQRITSLIMRHMNDIIWMLQNDPENYEPLIYEREHDGKTVSIIDEWCTGFVQGAMLDGNAWAPLFDSEEDHAFLLPIVLYGTETGLEELEKKPELAQRHDKFAEALPSCVLAVRDYWMPARKAKSTFRREEPIPGRNDLCPCGSGKKYKKCCGDPAKLS